MDSSTSSPSHSSNRPMQYHHQRLPSHLFHEHPQNRHFSQDSGPPPPNTETHPPSTPLPHQHLEMQSRMASHTRQQEMYSSPHPPSHEGSYPAYPLPENVDTRFSTLYQLHSPLHAPHFTQQYNTGEPPTPDHHIRQDSFPMPMSEPMPVPSPMSMLPAPVPQHGIPILPELGLPRMLTGEVNPTQHQGLPVFQTYPPPSHLLQPGMSPYHASPSPHNVPNHSATTPTFMANVSSTRAPQTHHNTTSSFMQSRPPPSQHIPHLSNRNNGIANPNSPSNARYVRTFANAMKQGLNNVNGSPHKPQKHHQAAQNIHQHQEDQRNSTNPQHSQKQRQQQQKTPKQRRFYTTQGQYQHYNNAETSSPFKYNHNRRSSIVSNASGSSALNHSAPMKRCSFHHQSNFPTTEGDGYSQSGNTTFVEEEGVWNGSSYRPTGLQGGVEDASSGTTWSPSDTVLYPYSSIGVEQPYLTYQPCMNTSCPNIYHYTQQIFQPVSEAHPTGVMTLVDIPGTIQAPAWCELSPCGCTICRDCFTSIIAKREILPAPPSSDIGINIQGRDMYQAALKRFNCLICSVECKEFGPINEALQTVVESAKAVYDTQQESGFNQTSDASGYYEGDPIADTKYLKRQEEERKLSANAIIPTTNFDGFQSAQDIASGKFQAPVSVASNADTGTSENVSTCSTVISPLLQLVSGSNRYAKSDPPPSIPHFPLVLPVKKQQNIEHLRAHHEVEEKKDSDSMASIDFPSLLKDMVQVTLPSRKISATSTNTTSTTNTFDSPLPDSTPDFGTWSSSSASIKSMPSSPETCHSPTMALHSVDMKSSNTPWKQNATPTYYEAKSVVRKAQKPNSKESIDIEVGKDSEKYVSMPGKLHQVESHSIGLGLNLGTAHSPISRKTTHTSDSNNPATRNLQEKREERSISHTPMRETFLTPAKKGKNKGKAKAVANASPNESLPTPTPQKPRQTRENISSSPTTMSPYRSYRLEGPMTPSRPSRGHSRPRGGGAYIAAHQARMAELSQQHQTPHKPARNDLFGLAHNRTDTQSSIHTSQSSSSNSAGSCIFQPHGRKVSMAENRLSKLPELLANPSQEQISMWKDNKAKWWIDPWLGHLMGIQEQLIGGEKVMFRSDGSRLVDGRAAGISWPILKVHNIAFSTTITDIESFVPDCTLAPLAYNAQAVHLLCDLSDGKTRPYAYVECISTDAAERVIRESDGKYLAGRQVGIRPVTQKELALDLVSRLRRNSYWRDAIIANSPPRPEHQRQHSGAFNNLDLFSDRDYQQLNKLFDKTLPSNSNEEDNNAEDPERSNYFFFPPERPFARLISMIVKYPYHAISESDKLAEHYNQEIDRLIGCVLYAVEKLAPHIDKQPALSKVWDRLHTAVAMCPAFDGPRRDILTSAWGRHSQVLYAQSHGRAK